MNSKKLKIYFTNLNVVFSLLFPAVPTAQAVGIKHEQHHVDEQPHQRCEQNNTTRMNPYLTSEHFANISQPNLVF